MKAYSVQGLLHYRMTGEDSFYVARDVHALLWRCVDALEDDKLSAAEAIEKNKGWPARQKQLESWLKDSTALYDEVLALLAGTERPGVTPSARASDG